MRIEIKSITKKCDSKPMTISIVALVDNQKVQYQIHGYERIQFEEGDERYFGNRPYYEERLYHDAFNSFSALVYAGTGICFPDYFLNNPKKEGEITRSLNFLKKQAENCRRAKVIYEALKKYKLEKEGQQ